MPITWLWGTLGNKGSAKIAGWARIDGKAISKTTKEERWWSATCIPQSITPEWAKSSRSKNSSWLARSKNCHSIKWNMTERNFRNSPRDMCTKIVTEKMSILESTPCSSQECLREAGHGTTMKNWGKLGKFLSRFNARVSFKCWKNTSQFGHLGSPSPKMMCQIMRQSSKTQ